MKLSKETKQYDKFVHKIQQKKMKELWDNKNDDIWKTHPKNLLKRIC